MKYRYIVVCLFLLIFICCNSKNFLDEKDIKNILENNLKKGDSKYKIDNFLKSTGWIIQYDDYHGRYVVWTGKGKSRCSDLFQIIDCVIVVFIYVDENGKMKYFVVEKHYSFL